MKTNEVTNRQVKKGIKIKKSNISQRIGNGKNRKRGNQKVNLRKNDDKKDKDKDKTRIENSRRRNRPSEVSDFYLKRNGFLFPESKKENSINY